MRGSLRLIIEYRSLTASCREAPDLRAPHSSRSPRSGPRPRARPGPWSSTTSSTTLSPRSPRWPAPAASNSSSTSLSRPPAPDLPALAPLRHARRRCEQLRERRRLLLHPDQSGVPHHRARPSLRLAPARRTHLQRSDAHDLSGIHHRRRGPRPQTARAITYNLTVADTVTVGFLSLFPFGAAFPGNSSINWFPTNEIDANGGVVALGGDRQISVLCGGGGSTDFILDVTGYFL